MATMSQEDDRTLLGPVLRELGYEMPEESVQQKPTAYEVELERQLAEEIAFLSDTDMSGDATPGVPGGMPNTLNGSMLDTFNVGVSGAFDGAYDGSSNDSFDGFINGALPTPGMFVDSSMSSTVESGVMNFGVDAEQQGYQWANMEQYLPAQVPSLDFNDFTLFPEPQQNAVPLFPAPESNAFVHFIAPEQPAQPFMYGLPAQPFMFEQVAQNPLHTAHIDVAGAEPVLQPASKSKSAIEATCLAHVETYAEAKAVVEACIAGHLRLVTRHMKREERAGLVKAGNVFVHRVFRKEEQAELKALQAQDSSLQPPERWTDGQAWTAARWASTPNGQVTIYHELVGKPGSEEERKTMAKRQHGLIRFKIDIIGSDGRLYRAQAYHRDGTDIPLLPVVVALPGFWDPNVVPPPQDAPKRRVNSSGGIKKPKKTGKTRSPLTALSEIGLNDPNDTKEVSTKLREISGPSPSLNPKRRGAVPGLKACCYKKPCNNDDCNETMDPSLTICPGCHHTGQ